MRRGIWLFAAVALVAFSTDLTRAQVAPDRPDAPMQMLDPLTGATWHGQGDGFSSTLEYRWIFKGRLLEAVNEVRNASGNVVARYHGAYLWEPQTKEIVFWTMAEGGELHRGVANWRDGVLWHEANVTGGRIQGYASAVRLTNGRLEYFADYGTKVATPVLLDLDPLVYERTTGAPASGSATDSALEIRTASGTALEERGREQLRRLVASYDVERWLFTRTIRIESGVIPHSDPVLTLSTRYLENDTAALATFLHEQLHWFVSAQPDSTSDALKAALRQRYPNAPDGRSGGGARDLESTYLHLIVCTLEYEATAAVFGRAVARRVLESWTHYPWIYRTVLADNEELVKLLERHGMGIRDASVSRGGA